MKFNSTIGISTNSGMKLSLSSKWWSFSSDTLIIGLVFATFLSFVHCEEPQLTHSGLQDVKYREADITVTISEQKKDHHSFKIQGKFGIKSPIMSISGIVIHAVSYKEKDKKNHHGCSKYDFPVPTSGPWISLVERGECNFFDKVQWAAKANATAVVVYNNSTQKDVEVMDHQAAPIVSVIISKDNGLTIIHYLEKEMSKVRMDIVPGEEKGGAQPNTISKTSVLFVSISFIVLMIISLAWLGFYYIQRFRYSHAKERLARRLACAAKKAIAKIPQKTIKSGDKMEANTRSATLLVL
ncbi:hypothetical protein Btru_066220 [Bulinus truncatus]|nr:hypothetical protein Btru_066220 [Bulinus truncatus]